MTMQRTSGMRVVTRPGYLRCARYLLLMCIVGYFFVLPVWAESIPVIYTTDLFHPPDDPDDDVDLATLFALKELDVRGIILDQGRDQVSRPGGIPVGQLNAITGRKVPHARGLAHPLRYPEDTGEDQPGGQEGPELILSALRSSPARVMMIATGSMRDIAAAFNRDPSLFHQRVSRIYVNAGHSSGKLLEWNTALDPQAYLRIMKSDLPVYWVPCFSSNTWTQDFIAGKIETEPHQSYWKFRQGEVYEGLPVALQNYFLYALGRIPPVVKEPIGYLQQPVDFDLRKRQWQLYRNMWSTVSFYHAAGRTLRPRGDEWIAEPSPGQEGHARPSIFEFIPARVLIDTDLRTTLEFSGPTGFKVLNITDLKNYQHAMTTSLRHLLREMALMTPYRDID